MKWKILIISITFHTYHKQESEFYKVLDYVRVKTPSDSQHDGRGSNEALKHKALRIWEEYVSGMQGSLPEAQLGPLRVGVRSEARTYTPARNILEVQHCRTHPRTQLSKETACEKLS